MFTMAIVLDMTIVKERASVLEASEAPMRPSITAVTNPDRAMIPMPE